MLIASKNMLHTIKDKVEYLLDELPATRDSDKKLLWAYWRHFDNVSPLMSEEEFIEKTTPAESITRARRELQEQGLYPATEKIKEARSAKEKVCRDTFGGVKFVEAPNPRQKVT